MSGALDPDIRARMLAPPRATADLPDIGGRLRACVEDFLVEELPAYPPDGGEAHRLLTMTKRGLDTEQALRELARALQVPRAEIGLAGLKDRHAITTQWISVPAGAAERLPGFEHPAIALGPAHPHSHKLRRGHLRGNRFTIVVRDAALPFAPAREAAEAKLAVLTRAGLRNAYGEQRFGHEGRNLEAGLAILRGRGRRGGKADLITSAGQSGLFNLYLAERALRGAIDRVLLGDVLQKRSSGGLFESTDPDTDQARLDAGELVVTGPIFGSRMRWPGLDTPARALEHEILALAGVDPAKLDRLGRAIPGTRRPLLVWPEQVGVDPEPAPARPDQQLGEGLILRFVLPAGSYATVLLRELMGE